MFSKESIIKYCNAIINYIEKIKSHFEKKEEEKEMHFSHLNAVHLENEEIQNYTDKLSWGINNNEVKNIAITGSYGTGKSSIIKSFVKNKNLMDISLTISFANFENNEELIKKEEIEFNIVNQIIYSEKHGKLNNSRFKRIANKSWNHKFWSIFFIVVYLYTIINIFFPSINGKLSIFPYWEYQKNIYVIIFIIQTFIVLYRLYDDVINFRITKISPTDIEITNDNKESNESILSKYYDEILNFFLNSKVEIVFIEDLDRFNGSLSIFTHLRQINEQLNNSKDLKHKKITFVYAVKDDLLDDEHKKTKFFDLIIPILPFINSNTSREFITKKISELEGDLLNNNKLKNIIKEVSPYINDTRTAINLINEFIVFKQQYISNWEKNNQNITPIATKLPLDKIFGIIVYKNLYTYDYVNLLYNNFESIVYSIFYNKDEFIKNSISNKTKRIEEIEKEISELEAIYIPDIESLNKIMINSFILLLNANYNDLINIKINRDNINLENLHKNENFQTLKDDIKIKQNGYNNFERTTITFESIKKKSGLNYQKEYENIKKKSENEIEKLQKEKNELNKSIGIVKSKSVSELINRYSNENLSKYTKVNEITENDEDANNKIILHKNQLLFFLIKYGYINEQYLNYISHKHEGLLDFNDLKFRNKILDNVNPEFNYEIKNINDFMEDLSPSHFNSRAIFNYLILDFLIKNSNKFEYEYSLFYSNLLSDEEFQKDFIAGAFSSLSQENRFKFYYKLIESESFWKNLENQNEIINAIIISIIKEKENQRNKLLIKLNIEKKLIEYLKYNEEILKEATKEDINSLNMNVSYKITDLNHFIDDDTQRYIYENNMYYINESNLEVINSKITQKNIKDWKLSNLWNFSVEPLDDYIYENIKEFLENIYFSNVTEEDGNGISILNRILTNENIDSDYTKRYIKDIKFQIDLYDIDFSVIDFDDNLFKPLLEFNRVKPSWNNVKIIYSRTQLTDELLSFINLNKNEIENDQDLSIENDEELIASLIKSDKIEDFRIFDATDIKFDEIEDYIDYIKFIEYIITTNRIDLNTEVFNIINEENKLHFINNYIRQDLDLNELEIDKYTYSRLIKESEQEIATFLVKLILNDFDKIDFEEERIVSMLIEYINENNINVDFNILDYLLSHIDEENIKIDLISIKFRLCPHLAEDDVITLLKHTDTFRNIEEKQNYKIELNEVNNEILNYLKSKKIIKHHFVNHTENKYTITF
ncbi:putative membrane protein YobI [Empedobacter brevis NBRC 14943 = ATCC 43319]|uniref:Putative membrane protein YobI n=1 Tax=Empedobacter brevis NBRC 14943 = ATCC 43319 TaxID=1218108 RepID=A0A511NLU2_9FLAO|nr:hypothetical protein [Empedobacter brevis]GEM53716.1 putative membrane protein YobI [Empedobacter brevis NBRC 14943 = ATCC 43319]